ncbi:MAG: hypothetical protein AAGH88_12660 [Planctomycetota bacterium]
MLLLAVPGCSTYRDLTASPQTAQRLAAFDYPADAPYGPDLDVLVIRSNADIRLVNRTPRNYSAMQLWLNQQWVADSGLIQIGTDNTRVLTDFVNRLEEPYPVGTVLNPEKTLRLVLAELYNPAEGVRHRLVVRPGNEQSITPFEDLR